MLVSKRDILKGEELTVNYNYPFASAPLWYKRILKQHIEENLKEWREQGEKYEPGTMLTHYPQTGPKSIRISRTKQVNNGKDGYTVSGNQDLVKILEAEKQLI